MADSHEFTIQELNAILTGYGIPTGFFSELIAQAVRENWSSDELVGRIYGSTEFHDMFPGYFRPDGSAQFQSAATYLAQKDQYFQVAYQLGYKLDDATVAALFEGDKSVQEVADELTAVARIDESSVYFNQFQRQLDAAGIKNVSHANLVDFVLGQAPKEWYDLWEKTSIGASAKDAGIGLNQKLIDQVAEQIPPGTDLGSSNLSQSMEEIAKNIRTTLPLSQVYKFGLTKSDLIAAQFGGKDSASAREKIQRVIDTNGEFWKKPRAHAQFQPNSQGGVATYGGQQQEAQVQ